MDFSIASQNAVLGTDYQASSYSIQLLNGQTNANVPVQIFNDDLPEFNESLVIQLEESSLTGGAKLGSPRECTVTILENDYPYGLIGMFLFFSLYYPLINVVISNNYC